jgi:hypothetical protein
VLTRCRPRWLMSHRHDIGGHAAHCPRLDPELPVFHGPRVRRLLVRDMASPRHGRQSECGRADGRTGVGQAREEVERDHRRLRLQSSVCWYSACQLRCIH